MALNINGTTGISGVDGSVSAPALTGTDSNTGITFPAADTIKFSTGGVERMQITNSGVSGTGISAGKILQVAQTFKQDTQSITGAGNTLINGLGTTMTLSNANNKILVLLHISFGQSANNYAHFDLYDGSSAITAAQSTGAVTRNSSITYYVDTEMANSYLNFAFNFLYSPGDTNAHTINLYGNPFNTTLYINRSNSTLVYGTSSMTLMEVAA